MGKPRYPNTLYLDHDVKLNCGSNVTIRKRQSSPLLWYGSKALHLKFILPLLPKCNHFVEPFGGSAVVVLNRDPSPIETYNDINGDVVNFFFVLRNQLEELKHLIQYTPYSREEFARALYEEGDFSPIERARRFFIVNQQTFNSCNTTAKFTNWASCTHGTKNINVQKALTKQRTLEATAERLKRVQIENRPAIDCVLKYDTPDTLFYCDPPYVHSTRRRNTDYANEMTDNDHRELAEVLNNAVGKVAVSGYENELYDELYPQDKWFKYYDKEKITAASDKNLKRQEVLWTNYKVE